MWRPRGSRVFCEYVKVDSLEWNNPELLKKINKCHPAPYFNGHFIYHKTRTGLNIERIEKELYDIMGWGWDGEPEKIDHT